MKTVPDLTELRQSGWMHLSRRRQHVGELHGDGQ